MSLMLRRFFFSRIITYSKSLLFRVSLGRFTAVNCLLNGLKFLYDFLVLLFCLLPQNCWKTFKSFFIGQWRDFSYVRDLLTLFESSYYTSFTFIRKKYFKSETINIIFITVIRMFNKNNPTMHQKIIGTGMVTVCNCETPLMSR